MTATAPASSAILACSAVTTSMITPPRSMSARPRLTVNVPVRRSSPFVICPGHSHDSLLRLVKQQRSRVAGASSTPDRRRRSKELGHHRPEPPEHAAGARRSRAPTAVQEEDRRPSSRAPSRSPGGYRVTDERPVVGGELAPGPGEPPAPARAIRRRAGRAAARPRRPWSPSPCPPT